MLSPLMSTAINIHQTASQRRAFCSPYCATVDLHQQRCKQCFLVGCKGKGYKGLCVFSGSSCREVEQQLLQVKSGTLPSQFSQLVDDHNTARRAQQQPLEQQADLAGQEGADKAPVSTEPDLVASDLDMPILSWLGVSVLLPQEGKVSC